VPRATFARSYCMHARMHSEFKRWHSTYSSALSYSATSSGIVCHLRFDSQPTVHAVLHPSHGSTWPPRSSRSAAARVPDDPLCVDTTCSSFLNSSPRVSSMPSRTTSTPAKKQTWCSDNSDAAYAIYACVIGECVVTLRKVRCQRTVYARGNSGEYKASNGQHVATVPRS
jgi:hypothetical protein